ncbi:unnamed protein product [Prorocentrum cordatum]|uniref:Uncharacterized protein n=1 Tax=Prorocentrum cordatum TaxID=2364126 RepID=A0ABN9UD10_9DINO|nr:unnamed protein product [Polarella glacialis]
MGGHPAGPAGPLLLLEPALFSRSSLLQPAPVSPLFVPRSAGATTGAEGPPLSAAARGRPWSLTSTRPRASSGAGPVRALLLARLQRARGEAAPGGSGLRDVLAGGATRYQLAGHD